MVGKLGKGHTLRELPVETLLDGVFRHHIIDGDEFTDIACKIEESIVFHPVVVVDQLSSIGRIGVEIEEPLQLALDAFLVVAQGRFVEQVTLCRLTARVADHTRSTANQRNRFVSATLQVA